MVYDFERIGIDIGPNAILNWAVNFQVLIYVLPVTFVSVVVNVPRWLELELTELNMPPDQVIIFYPYYHHLYTGP